MLLTLLPLTMILGLSALLLAGYWQDYRKLQDSRGLMQLSILLGELAELSFEETKAYMFDRLFLPVHKPPVPEAETKDIFVAATQATDRKLEETRRHWLSLDKSSIDKVTMERIEAGLQQAGLLPLWRMPILSGATQLPPAIEEDPVYKERIRHHIELGMRPELGRCQALWDIIMDGHYARLIEQFNSMVLDAARVTRDAHMARSITLQAELSRFQTLVHRENGLLRFFVSKGSRPHGLLADDIGWLRSIWDRETSLYQNAWSLASEEERRLIERSLSLEVYPNIEATRRWLAANWINSDMAHWKDLDVSQLYSPALDRELAELRNQACVETVRQLRTGIQEDARQRIASQGRTMGILALLIGAGVTLTLLVFRWVNHSFFVRVLDLSTMVHHVRETGDTSLRVPEGESDEVGELEEAFNEMLSSLEDGRRRLEEAREALESRVNERTLEVKQKLADVERLNRDMETVLTELKASKAQAEESARRLGEMNQQLLVASQELESFTYTASHDLRTPIRNINGFIELLLRHSASALDTKALHHIEVVQQETKRMSTLIDELLEFSRIGCAEFKDDTVRLLHLLDEIRKEFSERTMTREIEWRIGELPEFRGDERLMKQAMSILVDNAIKFTAPRKRACIYIDCRTDAEGGLEFRVRDNGVGFNPEYVDKLFRVFQRLHGVREFPGTGVGLANLKRIITRHGGRVWAEGKVEEGACFGFSIPPSRVLPDSTKAAG